MHTAASIVRPVEQESVIIQGLLTPLTLAFVQPTCPRRAILS